MFVFAFFAGVFTKSIEEWIYAAVKKLLPGDKLKEVESRSKYDVSRSDLAKKLGLDEDLVYILYALRVRTIEDLASSDLEKLFLKVNMKVNGHFSNPYNESVEDTAEDQSNKQVNESKEYETRNTDNKQINDRKGAAQNKAYKPEIPKYSKQQIQAYIEKAQKYMGIDESELVTALEMDRDLAFKLSYYADVKTIRDLSAKKSEDIYKHFTNIGIKVNKNKIQEYINKANNFSANFNASSVCGVVPLSVIFTNTSTGATTYAWDFGDKTEISKEQSPTHIFDKNGTYDAVLTVGDGKGNLATKHMVITVYPPPPIADFDADKTSGNAPLKVRFTDKSKGASSWQWNFRDDNKISIEQNPPEHEFIKAGIYDVVLTVSDNKGQSDSKSVRITVNSSEVGSPGPGTGQTTTTAVSEPAATGSVTDLPSNRICL